MWIAYAERPLQMMELICAVVMESGINSSAELESMVPTIKTLLGVCTNLIVLDDSGQAKLGEDFRTVRFVHFSVLS